MKVTIAVYDDELHKDTGDLIRGIVAWLRSQPECEVQEYASAAALIHALVNGERFHIALIDIDGKHDSVPEANVRLALESAVNAGFDIHERLDLDFLRKRGGVSDWLGERLYGIGLLAAMAASGCPDRLAISHMASQGGLVDYISYLNLANLGVVPRERELAELRLTKIITDRRRSWRAAPELYEVKVIAETGGEKRGDEFGIEIEVWGRSGSGVGRRLNVDGDHALILKRLVDANGQAVSGGELRNTVNQHRRAVPRHTLYLPEETRKFLKAFDVELLSAKYPERADLCKPNNDVLCQWQKTGEEPEYGMDGFECRRRVGWCAKCQIKVLPPDPRSKTLSSTGAAERRKVGELRKAVKERLGPYLGDAIGGKKGLIYSVGKDGYALAAIVR